MPSCNCIPGTNGSNCLNWRTSWSATAPASRWRNASTARRRNCSSTTMPAYVRLLYCRNSPAGELPNWPSPSWKFPPPISAAAWRKTAPYATCCPTRWQTIFINIIYTNHANYRRKNPSRRRRTRRYQGHQHHGDRHQQTQPVVRSHDHRQRHLQTANQGARRQRGGQTQGARRRSAWPRGGRQRRVDPGGSGRSAGTYHAARHPRLLQSRRAVEQGAGGAAQAGSSTKINVSPEKSIVGARFIAPRSFSTPGQGRG